MCGVVTLVDYRPGEKVDCASGPRTRVIEGKRTNDESLLLFVRVCDHKIYMG